MVTNVIIPDSPWSIFVKQHAIQPFYYSQTWLKLITELYGFSLIPLTTTDTNGQIAGFLPLCLVNSALTGRHLVSLPFSDHCPVLASNEAGIDDLVNQAIHLAQEQKVRYLELRAGVNEALARRRDLVQENVFLRWLLPLASDPGMVWSRLRKPVQHQIKKSRKLGVRVRVAQHREDMAHYYRLHLRTRCKKHGMPAQPEHYFFGLWDAFAASSAIQLLLAEYEGVVIAGMILLASDIIVQYAYGASDENYLHLAPNNLLMWAAIEWGCTHGYQTLDMGRTAGDNVGLMEFKRRWGAMKEPLPYYYYPHTAGLAATSESSWKFRLLTACWRRLPLQVAGPLGGRFYRHLA